MDTSDIILKCGDCLELMDELPESVIDITITSPQYNVGIDYGISKDDKPYSEYIAFSEKWLTKLFRISKRDGRLCLNVPIDTPHGGRISFASDMIQLAKNIGWKYQFSIVWIEESVAKRTAWGSWLSASSPFITQPLELICVFAKEIWKKESSGESTISSKDFTSWTNGIWRFNGEHNKIGHPAPFPIELPKRCIELFSYRDDTVFDPFMGSGTTGVACVSRDRKFIGFEINPKYFAIAEKRINRALASRGKVDLITDSGMKTTPLFSF